MDNQQSPNFNGFISGFRTWKWDGNHLYSQGNNKIHWDVNMEAECLAEEYENCLPSSHAVPDPKCTCGFYTGFELMIPKPVQEDYLNVSGVCKIWGRVQVHPNGMRSQFISPFALLINPGEQNRQPDLFVSLQDWSIARNIKLCFSSGEITNIASNPLPQHLRLYG